MSNAYPAAGLAPRGPARKRGGRAARLRLAVQYAVSARGLPTGAQLRRWARAALACDASITVRFVGRTEGRALNRRFRGVDRATNVLSFGMRSEPPLAGDLALCVPVISREAREHGRSLAAHCAHLVIHGVLHLQGYDHETPREARVMEQRESGLVTGLGFADPYQS